MDKKHNSPLLNSNEDRESRGGREQEIAQKQNLGRVAITAARKVIEQNNKCGDTAMADRTTFHDEPPVPETRPMREVEDYQDVVEDDQTREEYGSANRTFEVFPVSSEILEQYPLLQELPHDIGVMGGMARSIARRMIAGENEPIRDIDLIQIDNPEDPNPTSRQELDELSQKYMPDDYAYGYGIKKEELYRYFDTRDVTVNEVLILNGALVASNFAYNDLQENIIRPTTDRQYYSGNPTPGREAMRALTMQAALMESTESYPTLEDYVINPWFIRDFDVAVQLNKAMSRGVAVATNLTKLMVEYDIIPQNLAGKPIETAKYWKAFRVERFEFRPNADERVAERKVAPKDENAAMKEFYTSDPTIREALAEYEDSEKSPPERSGKYYTQADFDAINATEFKNYYYDDDDDDDYYYEDYEDEDNWNWDDE